VAAGCHRPWRKRSMATDLKKLIEDRFAAADAAIM
jgi:hypothetical protein